MSVILTIVGVVVGLAGGGAAAYYGARSRAKAILAKAEADGEMIKKEKILQAKEKFFQLKSEHDRNVNERNQKLQQSEQRAKQLESNLQHKERELDKKSAECDRRKEQLDQQMQGIESRKEELAAIIKEQNVRLEQISGMSSEDAKNVLIENMKSEAKADAAAYIAETIEEAKLSATKEAKRIVVASIQRVATETAIENAVTVFNIESDEVKGQGSHHRPRGSQHPRVGGSYGHRDYRGRYARGYHPFGLRPRAQGDCTFGSAPARHRRSHPPRTYRGGRCQGQEADRGGDCRGW